MDEPEVSAAASVEAAAPPETAVGGSAEGAGVAPVQSGPLPAPVTLDGAGLTIDVVTPLVLKTLFFAGQLSGAELSRRLGLAYSVIEPSLDFLKHQRHVVVASGTMLAGSSYRYRITDDGRSSAALLLQQNHYVGVAPVPLDQYRAYMESHRQNATTPVTPESVRSTLSGLVLSDEVLDEIAPAVNSGHSAFIYGPPGNGKTTIAKAIEGFFTGSIAIPHAIEVEGNIIRVFDAVNHKPLPEQADDSLAPNQVDRRWVVCERPAVVSGGELTLESLELSYDDRLGYYRAPLQLVANGGMLILDDFGRQRTAPRDLLNRWMVPLESGIDFLTLRSGVKFELPFHAFVVFATNIKPSELVDEAFLRRVRHKVYAENPTPESFARIFEGYCRARGLDFNPALVEQLFERTYRPRGIALRACHPRDLINQALLLANYRGEPPVLTIDLLERASTGYFVEDRG